MEWTDGKTRCFWANPKNERYIKYHDTEWGVPVHEDGKLFEMLILESFQAGLSWECVLNKREAFRQAFDGFDPEKIMAYGEEKIEELAGSPGIIRNRKHSDRAGTGQFSFIRRSVKGPEKTGHVFCGHHHYVCVPSGRGSHQFS